MNSAAVLLPPRQRTNRHRYIVVAYLAGAVAGATITAALAWVASGFFEPVAPTIRIALLVGVAVLVWTVKFGVLARHIRLPENRRQIPFEVFAGSLTRGAWRFGLEMGTGFRTYLPAVAPYVLLVGLILTRPTVGHALLAAVGFGIGRAVPLMVSVAPDNRVSITNEFLRGVEHRSAQAAAGVVVLGGALLLV